MESCANIGIVCQVTQAIGSVAHICIQVISGGEWSGKQPLWRCEGSRMGCRRNWIVMQLQQRPRAGMALQRYPKLTQGDGAFVPLYWPIREMCSAPGKGCIFEQGSSLQQSLGRHSAVNHLQLPLLAAGGLSGSVLKGWGVSTEHHSV